MKLVPVVAGHPIVDLESGDLLEEAQDVHGIDLGYFCEPEPPLRDELLGVARGCPQEFGEFLAAASAILQHEGEERRNVSAPLIAILQYTRARITARASKVSSQNK